MSSLPIQLRLLSKELSEEPPELQFRYVTDTSTGGFLITDWESVPTHTKKINGDVIDERGNIVQYGRYSVNNVDPNCQLVHQENIGSIKPLFTLPDSLKKLFSTKRTNNQ